VRASGNSQRVLYANDMNLAQKRQITDAIIQLESHLEFSTALHPVNTEEQKSQFLSGEIQEPSFVYAQQGVSDIAFPDVAVETELDALYRDRIGFTKSLVLLLGLIGSDQEFSSLSQVLFSVGHIGKEPVLLKKKEEATVSAEQVVQTFRQALLSCNLTDWKVETSHACSSRLFVNQWTKKVVVREDVSLTTEELSTLTRHEIGVHVLRYARGSAQQEPLLRVGTLLGRLGEEGVACYVENPQGHSRWYLRHLSVQTALSHSFRETWQVLQESGCSPEEAWVHTLRVKRGLADGASHGAFTRDTLYAQGYEEILHYVQGGGDLAPLLSAPIHHQEVELLKREAHLHIFPLVPTLHSNV